MGSVDLGIASGLGKNPASRDTAGLRTPRRAGPRREALSSILGASRSAVFHSSQLFGAVAPPRLDPPALQSQNWVMTGSRFLDYALTGIAMLTLLATLWLVATGLR